MTEHYIRTSKEKHAEENKYRLPEELQIIHELIRKSGRFSDPKSAEICINNIISFLKTVNALNSETIEPIHHNYSNFIANRIINRIEELKKYKTIDETRLNRCKIDLSKLPKKKTYKFIYEATIDLYEILSRPNVYENIVMITRKFPDSMISKNLLDYIYDPEENPIIDLLKTVLHNAHDELLLIEAEIKDKDPNI
ncbi:MAG: hypothetical protein MHMPM18_003041, partial [Marteilia pararefringens]